MKAGMKPAVREETAAGRPQPLWDEAIGLVLKQAEALARWEKLVTREDVATAINEVGRREKAPMYNVPD